MSETEQAVVDLALNSSEIHDPADSDRCRARWAQAMKDFKSSATATRALAEFLYWDVPRLLAAASCNRATIAELEARIEEMEQEYER